MVAHSPAEREQYEANLKARRDEFSRLAFARESGRTEGRMEGQREGELAATRSLLIQLGQLQMGLLPEQHRHLIDRVQDLELLKSYLMQVHPSRTWDELLTVPHRDFSHN